MHWVEKPGTSLEAMRRITVSASRELRDVPGRAQLRLAHRPGGGRRRGRRAQLHRAVDQPRPDGRLRRDGGRRSSRVVDGYPGLSRDLLTYLRERIKEVLTGASATIVVRIFGPDLT